MNVERRFGGPLVPSAEEFEEHFRQAFGREMTPDERKYFFLGAEAGDESQRRKTDLRTPGIASPK
jgi:hypothetical protein